MSTDNRDHTHNESDSEHQHLLMQLRGLRREQMPEADLWPSVAARIAAEVKAEVEGEPGALAADGNVVTLRSRPHFSRFAPWALAASLVLALGMVWQQRPDIGAGGVGNIATAPASQAAHPIERVADAMAMEYDAALLEVRASGVRSVSPEALRQLDHSAAQIRAAIARDPDARFLLERLRQTYEKRLELSQRPAYS